MFHTNAYLVVCVLLAVYVSMTISTTTNIRPVQTRDEEQTECDVIKRISHVCYQCSNRHDEQFVMMYTACCSGRESDFIIRDYCEAIYTEPPKRGGLWY